MHNGPFAVTGDMRITAIAQLDGRDTRASSMAMAYDYIIFFPPHPKPVYALPSAFASQPVMQKWMYRYKTDI
ncbi:hypothetical protein M404DRAFT_1001332 [Pisolithus tinctorius Marx 270]|uniref:Uncharacterized protein n=1 Tax=Pisolithus tinctorius Marx 270 TaxID=870435 RepID=A0A0C3K1K8_PISTI|nr:hypothetical protein M404DRAFT_1001332 [Pisolithus tinctorius Marx 270]